MLLYASESGSRYQDWARETIAQAVSTEGVAINAACLGEICVGETEPTTAADRIRGWGVEIFDVPAAAADICAAAYRRYRHRRQQQSRKDPPRTPSETTAYTKGVPMRTTSDSRRRTTL